MATSPPTSFSTINDKIMQISSWLEELPPTPPADEERGLLKRKRATPEPTSVHQFTTMSAHRSVSPSKRQRRDSDDLRPEQSVSAVGSNARPLILGSSTTFSPPGSRVGASTPRRSNSPSRETIAALRVASPPITTEPLDGVESEPPARVMAVVARLENGLDQGWIPGPLEVQALRADTDIGFRRFKPVAFSDTATHNLSDPDLDPTARAELEYTLRKVKKIFKKALHCQTRGRDENAWCDDVVRPMSQNIDVEFLSRAADASGKQRILDRKADYTLSYSHDTSPFEALYARLLQHGNQCISHTTDAFTKTTAVFSGVEVKPSDGDKLEAEYQLSIWMAANLRKKAKLGRRAGLPDTTCLVEPGFTVVGHELYFYIAYMDSGQGEAVRILEFGNAATSSMSGVFKQLRMWRNVIEYGLDEGLDGFWGGFLKPVLERLAAGDE
ncbi:uncharacterized protein ALTATR162_LOCUS2981 [Alternaria atra]|uniref:PD-(D/E)XK nuclease-like domain-containing protein n=1 Tax=Alternaria atra TaxID=119953 RepID=A0A8J2HXU0_9PLEO|nr:uncharacterized protein ALTATR162_LOCUS2981 [Alternaria atra]CAG5152963.1 unnamed protein product [Alternaria atra]